MERPPLLRIKRRLDEDPLDVLVLRQPKVRRDGDVPDGIFRRLASVPLSFANDPTCAQDIRSQIEDNEAARKAAQPRKDPRALATAEERRASHADTAKKATKEARLRHVNQHRARGGDAGDEMERTFDLYDCEWARPGDAADRARIDPRDAVTCNLIPMVRESLSLRARTEYVYDVYCLEDEDAANAEDSIPVVSFDEELVLEHEYDEEEDMGEDEDSNDEGNWRNDYPDEDEWGTDRSGDSDTDSSEDSADFR